MAASRSPRAPVFPAEVTHGSSSQRTPRRPGRPTGAASSPLRSLLATFNRDKGLGAVNWGRYSNPKVGYVIEQPLQQVNDDNRRAMPHQATKLGMEDLGIMPIHFRYTIWATRKGGSYLPRTDGYTLAFQFKPVK